uniref:Uncharacterized protein n=1 Tax=viral metagenome TaxID=1070528 RepID=A0A6C0H7Y7_9ZZZZ
MGFIGFSINDYLHIPPQFKNLIFPFPYPIPGIRYPFIFNNCDKLINDRIQAEDKESIKTQLTEFLNKIGTTINTKKKYDDYQITLHFKHPYMCKASTDKYLENLKKEVLDEAPPHPPLVTLRQQILTAKRTHINNKYYKNNINIITVYFDDGYYKEIPYKGNISLDYIKELFTNEFNMFPKKK